MAWAGPFEDGFAAYERGDYAVAKSILQPLATQGDVHAQFVLGLTYYLAQDTT
jgi:uncharacterized protein